MDRTLKFRHIFITSNTILIVINLTFGTYLVGYERLFNSFFLHEFTSQLSYENNYNVWFLTAPIISFLNSKFIYSYHIIYSLIIISNLSIIIYNACLFLKIDKINIQILVSFIVSIFLFDIIIHISNRKIITFTVFNILFTAYNLIYKPNEKILKLFIYFLFPICITLRFEIAIILFGLGLFVAILFKDKKLIKASFIFLSICIFFFGIYHLLQNTVYKQYNYIEKAEHEIIDRNSVETNNVDKKEALKLQALSYFIVDKVNLNNNYYKELFLKKEFITSKFTSKYFNHIKQKIISFYISLFTDVYFLIYFILSFILIILINREKIKNTLILLFILFIPILFNIFLDFQTDLTQTMFLFVLLSLSIYFYYNYRFTTTYSKLISAALSLLMFYNIANMHFTKKHYENHDKQIFNYYRNVLHYAKKINKTVVFADLVGNFEAYPSKLFSIKKTEIILHYYLNMFFYAHFNYYKNHNNNFFTNIYSFQDRVKDVINNDAIFISNDEINNLITEYMKEVCNYKVSINPLILIYNNNNIQTSSFNTYEIVLNND